MVVGTGLASQTWQLPKELLVNASPFFAAALNGAFAEATSKTINLPEDDTDAFALFVRWLYFGEISGRLSDFEMEGDGIFGTWTSTSDDSILKVSSKIYLQACILGDKLGCPLFQDLATLELMMCYDVDRYQWNGAMRADTIVIIFSHFPPGSKLRQFAIDQLRFDVKNKNENAIEDAADFVSIAKAAEDFGLDFVKTCVAAHGRDEIDPNLQRGLYMEVLTIEGKTNTGT